VKDSVYGRAAERCGLGNSIWSEIDLKSGLSQSSASGILASTERRSPHRLGKFCSYLCIITKYLTLVLFPEELTWGWVVPECRSPLLHQCDPSAGFSLYMEDLILNCKTVSNTLSVQRSEAFQYVSPSS